MTYLYFKMRGKVDYIKDSRMMNKIKGLKDLKIGLVLAGGGAKGAYEAGVFKALWELDLMKQISVVSGTSVGAVNALLLCMNDHKAMKETWTHLSYSKLIASQENSRNYKTADILEKFKRVSNGNSSIIEELKSSDIGLLSQVGVKRFIEEFVDMKIIKDTNKSLYACAYNIDDEKPDYFRLNDYSKEEMINIVLASCAIPYIFKPIIINGKRYADGGIKNPAYTKNNTDNVPILPLRKYDLNFTIVIHLSYTTKINKNDYNGSPIINIYPSTPLELINGAGSLKISKSSLEKHIELGYRDAMVILAPIIIKIIQGKSFDDLIKRNDEKNNLLIS